MSQHYLFVGGPMDRQTVNLKYDPPVFYVDEQPDIDYCASISQDTSRGILRQVTSHEYIRQEHTDYGIIYVHKDTLDMWEFEREIEEA